MNITHTAGSYTLYKEKTAIGTATLQAGRLWVEIAPGWRRRGYGSYLVKEILQQNGIEAAVSLRDGTLYVTPARPADAPRVRQLLQENCGSLPYTVQSGGDAP